MRFEKLRLENITTYDGDIKTLNNLSLNLFEGEVLGLYVRSALEKEHLFHLLRGDIELEDGRICYENFQNDNIAPKFYFVEPKSKLIDDLTVAENIFVIRGNFRGYFIDSDVLAKQGNMIFKELGLEIDESTLAYKLEACDKVLVEIVKAFALGKKIIILDAPSSYLSDDDLKRVFELVKKLQANKISFIVVDSFMNILSNVAERACIIRDGKNIWTLKGDELISVDDNLIKSNYYPQRIPLRNFSFDDEAENEERAISFQNIELRGFESFSFKILPGEFVTILDSRGDAIEAIANILTGDKKLENGNIFIGGKLGLNLRHGIAFIPEAPYDNALFKDMKAIDNLCFDAKDKIRGFLSNMRFQKSSMIAYEKYFDEGDLKRYTDELSIYSRQKLAYLKWHLYRPKLVVCMRPFTSIEVELRELTAKMIELLLERGIAVISLTSNLSEVSPNGKKVVITSKECTP